MSLVAPHLLSFPGTGGPANGYLSVAEQTSGLPFAVQRVFWSYATPQFITRGRHAHHQLEQIVIAVAGKLVITTEDVAGTTQAFVLDSPGVGLYIPPRHWHVIQFFPDSVLMGLASIHYVESDYIRDYNSFKNLAPAGTTK